MQKDLSPYNQNLDQEKSAFFSSFETKLKKLNVKDLNLEIKKLNYLAEHLDPFNMIDLTDELKNIMNQYQLNQFESDPFLLTKIILKSIDIAKMHKDKRAH